VPVVCVFCRRQPVDPKWRPFCSDRCRIQDLARWADGTYRIPAESVAESDEDDQSQGAARESDDPQT
jgi:endogenous inhibitor of DNA gyrase (YacG/DUF329 family)